MQDFLVPAHDRGASRQSAAGRALARPAAMRRSGLRSGRAVPDAALAAAVGASHRLPCAARLGVVRRNSLRSLRELRSDRAPQVRSTMRASRADPEAALLGAADSAASGTARPLRSPERRMAAGRARARPAADCRSGNVGAIRSADGVVARKRRKASCKGVGRPRPACLCAAEKRSSTGGARSAHRPSFSRRLSERSSRSERSEFRRASRCCEHRRAPPRSGGKHRHAGRGRPTPLLARTCRTAGNTPRSNNR